MLAFGNGAPDIFSAIAVIKQPDPRKASLAIGALFGERSYFICQLYMFVHKFKCRDCISRGPLSTFSFQKHWDLYMCVLLYDVHRTIPVKSNAGQILEWVFNDA